MTLLSELAKGGTNKTSLVSELSMLPNKAYMGCHIYIATMLSMSTHRSARHRPIDARVSRPRLRVVKALCTYRPRLVLTQAHAHIVASHGACSTAVVFYMCVHCCQAWCFLHRATISSCAYNTGYVCSRLHNLFGEQILRITPISKWFESRILRS